MHMGLNFELILHKTRFESLFGFIFHFFIQKIRINQIFMSQRRKICLDTLLLILAPASEILTCP